MIRAATAEIRGDFKRSLQLMDDAAEIIPLAPLFRVTRARLLLRLERVDDAHRAFDAVRQELKGSAEPDDRYLRHYCTAMLSLMQPGSGQWSFEAKQANAIKCRRRVKALLPMFSADDIWENHKPGRD